MRLYKVLQEENRPLDQLVLAVLGWLLAFPAHAQAPSQVSAGFDHVLALARDGTVYAWGSNASFQLGHEDTQVIQDTARPVRRLTAYSRVIAVAAGNGFSLALTADGGVLSWGSGARGRLGDPLIFEQNRPNPAFVAGLEPGSGVVAIAAGPDYGVALKANGRVWAWGSNEQGQLAQLGGPFPAPEFNARPQEIAYLPPVRSIAAGPNHVLAVAFDGQVWGWGLKAFGAFCDRPTTERNIFDNAYTTAMRALRVGNVHRASAAYLRSVFVLNDGSAAMCGSSMFNAQCHDIRVQGIGGPTAPLLDYIGYASIPGTFAKREPSAGEDATYLLGHDGQMTACGANNLGQLGSGSINTTRNIIPIPVIALDTVAQIDAGGPNAIGVAVQCDGSVMTWGPHYANGIHGDGSALTSPRVGSRVRAGDAYLNLGSDPQCRDRLVRGGFEAWEAR